MKITIDTKEDSHDDIKRLITMLNHLVGTAQPAQATTFDMFSAGQEDTADLMSIFDAPPKTEEQNKQEKPVSIIPY